MSSLLGLDRPCCPNYSQSKMHQDNWSKKQEAICPILPSLPFPLNLCFLFFFFTFVFECLHGLAPMCLLKFVNPVQKLHETTIVVPLNKALE